MSSPAIQQIIGRAEIIRLPEILSGTVHARIDTGASISAIWHSGAVEEDGKLKVVFFGPGYEAYTGQELIFDTFERRLVRSSNGHEELRYMVKLAVVLKGRRVRARFTLADRSTQIYPVLIGRNVLRGKFIVDVKLGDVRKDLEEKRAEDAQAG